MENEYKDLGTFLPQVWDDISYKGFLIYKGQKIIVTMEVSQGMRSLNITIMSIIQFSPEVGSTLKNTNAMVIPATIPFEYISNSIYQNIEYLSFGMKKSKEMFIDGVEEYSETLPEVQPSKMDA